MKEEQDYIQDIAEIRSMMERSTKFLSLSGWAGIMAGIYALAGAWIAYNVYEFHPDAVMNPDVASGSWPPGLWNVLWLALLVLVLAVGTAVFLSWKKAARKGEAVWNATSRRMLVHMAVPLLTGGLLLLILLAKGFVGLMAPLSLLFYGLALYNASTFTYTDLKFLGLIQMGLGLVGTGFINYGMLFWALGFGVVHIVYGIYIHLRYER